MDNTITKDNKNDIDDLRLLARYYEFGCQASFNLICARHHQPLVRFLQKLLGNQKREAPDITQETFFRLHSHGYRERAIPHVRNWLFRVAGNLAVDLKKSAYNRRINSLEIDDANNEASKSEILAAQDADIQEVVATRELLGVIWIIVDDMNPKWAEAMRLVYRQGLTHTEAAKRMQVPRTTVVTWIRQCLVEVQQHFPETITACSRDSA